MGRGGNVHKSDRSTDEPIPLSPPRHGYQGDRGVVSTLQAMPAQLTVAVSREAGARGGTIGRRVGRKLGWQVYNQELLEYMAQDVVVRQELFDGLTPAA